MKPESFKLKSILIDNVYGYETDHVLIGEHWYYKRGLSWRSVTVKRKIEWCIEILRGKAIAVHFKEDEG